MKRSAFQRWFFNASLASFIFLLATSLPAQKSWVSPISGLWRDGTNWSGGTPPFSTNTVQIVNASNKVVTIDAAASELVTWTGRASSLA